MNKNNKPFLSFQQKSEIQALGSLELLNLIQQDINKLYSQELDMDDDDLLDGNLTSAHTDADAPVTDTATLETKIPSDI